MSFAILGQGSAVPSTNISQVDASNIAKSLCCRTDEHQTWLPAMYSQTGIQGRRLVLGDDLVADVINGTRHSGSIFLPSGEPDDRGPTMAERNQHYIKAAGPMALEATRQALDRAKVLPSAITHLVTVSCTGFRAPGVDYELITGLGLAPTTERTHIGFMGCHGALNGLRVANAFAKADPKNCILVCATELCSVHYHYGWDPQKMISNAIFGDGSAAVVGVSSELAPRDAWKVRATGSCLIPGSADAMTWTIGDFGFEMTLAKRVPGLIAQHLRPWMERWLQKQGLLLSDVPTWAVHPGGPRILTAVEEALGLKREQTAVPTEVFEEFGNMSSPTVLFILDRIRQRKCPRPCVALGFGPGLVAEATLFS